jgi:hypothetical protein
MNKYPSNFIPKGSYDKTNYRQENQYNNYDEKIQTKQFLGNFQDQFSITKINNNGESMVPLDINCSRQIYKTANKQNSYNPVDILQDDISKLFRSIDEEQIINIVSNVEKTHNDELDNLYDNKLNRSLKVNRIDEYNKENNFLDNNVNGVKEVINEYIINVNSVDRNCVQYPNPFDYKVLFNPADTKNAYITKVFKNVKYINLRNVIVPSRSVVLKKNINIITANQNNTDKFLGLFVGKKPNDQICTYNKYMVTVNNGTNDFYFYYFDILIDNEHYKLTTYDIYLDNNYKQKINLKISNSLVVNIQPPPNQLTPQLYNETILKCYLSGNNDAGLIFGGNTVSDGTNNSVTFVESLVEQNNIILIGNVNNKIKFCPQNDNFNNSIDITFELSYKQDYNIVTSNSNYFFNNQNSINYTKHNVSFQKVNNGTTYYFYYYVININNKVITFNIYSDSSYTNVLSLNVLDNKSNKQLIIDYFNGNKNKLNYIDTPQNQVTNGTISDNYKLSIDGHNYIYSKINNNINTLNFNNTISNMYILSSNKLSDDRYLLLSIKEIDNNNDYATDQAIENSFSVLFPDYYTDYYYYLDTNHHEKSYDDGNLGNITKMSIKFQNSSGSDININYKNILDYDIDTPKDKCICEYDTNTGEKIRNYQCSHSYLRHTGYEKLQNTLMFKVGVVEGIQNVQTM